MLDLCGVRETGILGVWHEAVLASLRVISACLSSAKHYLIRNHERRIEADPSTTHEHHKRTSGYHILFRANPGSGVRRTNKFGETKRGDQPGRARIQYGSPKLAGGLEVSID